MIDQYGDTILLLTGLLLFFHWCSVRAAYHNGVSDGYGYNREPWNPGYQKAGKYLHRCCHHRWHELKD